VKFLDGFAASGIRSIRLLKEMDPSLIHSIQACDIDPIAIKMTEKNCFMNQIDLNKIKSSLLFLLIKIF